MIETLALIQTEPLNANSAISIGLMISILAAAVYLSRVLTRTEEQLKQIYEKMKDLSELSPRITALESQVRTQMGIIENQVGNMEGDINNLWAAFRELQGEPGDTLANTRRARGPFNQGD